MSLVVEEVNETQKLMQNEIEEEEQKPPPRTAPTSPVASIKMSSGAASNTSKHTTGQQFNCVANSLNESAKISYINEKRLQREATRTNYTNKQKNFLRDATDVRHMEKSLLELLDDFHTGKLSAFGSSCSMDQMINIRDQQEHLAKLHFRLCADVDKTLEDNFDIAASREKMTQLVQKLEQLSASIENLHSGDNK